MEGLQSGEINDRAATFVPPFQVKRDQLTYYRKTRDADIKALIKSGEQDALSEGLATVAERVKKLKQLASLMESDLFGGFLWLDDVKGVGSGDAAITVDFEKFNAAEVSAYRETLNDIAKEMGHRVQRTEVSGKDGGPIETTDGLSDDERIARTIAILDAARARRTGQSDN